MALLGLAAAVTPGPLLAYLVTQSLSGGWRRGAPVAFAPLLSDLILVPVILLLLKQLNPLDYASLAWLEGSSSFTLPGSCGETGLLRKQGPCLKPRPGFSLRQGVLLNFLSPGAYTYWTTVNGPLVIRAWSISAWHAAGFVSAFYGLFVGSMLVLVLVLQFARQKAPQLVHGLMFAGIVILAVFGVFLLYNAVQG